MKEYIRDLQPIDDPLLLKMKDFASKHRIPIMDDESMAVLLSLIKLKRPKKILEIGAAIGYSAIRMAKAYEESMIISYDIDEERLKHAVANARECGLENRLKFVHGDVLEHIEQINGEGPYDFIFIDAAKSKYREYFDICAPVLNEHGVIVCDNVFFRGMVASSKTPEDDKRFRTIVKKLREFNRYIAQHERFHTTFYPVGDGLAVSIKV